MTRFVSALAVAALGLCAAPFARAADVSGVWLTDTADAHIRMARCGANFCGTIIWLKQPKDANGLPLTDAKNPDPAKRSHPLVGTMIAIGFHPSLVNPERLEGRFYNADDGKTYRGTMAAKSPDQLAVSGCLLIFCQTQIWTRVRR